MSFIRTQRRVFYYDRKKVFNVLHLDPVVVVLKHQLELVDNTITDLFDWTQPGNTNRMEMLSTVDLLTKVTYLAKK